MTIREAAYGIAVHAARPLLPVAALVSTKAARSVAGRRTSAASLAAWGRGLPGGEPVVWVHGASAGELLGAAPVVRCLRGARALRLLVTYASPSAESALGPLRPDHADFVPVDTLRETRRAVRGVAPAVLVFAKTDVWPNLTRAAEETAVPMVLVNGTVRPGSRRLRWPARSFLRPAYARLDRAGVATAGDADRLRRLGVPPEAVRVTGDAALDLAVGRADAERGPEARARLEARGSGRLPRIVAGSTWPVDERLLLEAALDLAASGRPVELVLVPHEPDEEAVRRILRWSRELLGVEPARWSEDDAAAAARRGRKPGGGAPPLVVDTVGILADLYGAADVAYVGGGFGADGLHSVVEPAAAGVPVVFGPRHDRWEARELLARGAAALVTRETVGDVLGRLLDDPPGRARMGEAARSFVESGTGAARAGAELILEALEALEAAG